jgi:hypothetical protein
MTPTPDLARLRASHFALESLPTTILVPAQPARFGLVAKPLAEAPLHGLTHAPAAIGTDRSVGVVGRAR